MDEDLKARLLKPRLPEADVEVPGIGTVRVRGLSRGEIMRISQGTDDGKNMEPFTLATCLIDPVFTEEEAAQWLETAPFGEIENVTQTINKISGIAKYADKEAYKSLPDRSDA